MFGYLAAVAPGLELVTGVIISAPAPGGAGRQASRRGGCLAPGKLRLGIGIGWNAVEYEALGMEFRNRGRRFEEQIDLMRKLWTEPVVTFEGKYHTLIARRPQPVARSATHSAVDRRVG